MENIIGSGLMMTGTWVNPTTGDKFTVKDCLVEDNNQAVVYTTDGRRLSLDMVSSYIQDVKGGEIPTTSATLSINDINQDPLDIVLPCDKTNFAPQYAQSSKEPKSQNDIILDRAFANIELPPISISIKWEKKAGAKLENLHDLMNISYEDIASYLTRHMTNKLKEDLTIAVRNSLSKYNNNNNE